MNRSLTLLDGALVLELLPAAPYSACDPLQFETLGIALERQRGVHAIDSDRRTDFDAWPGTLAYAPAGIGVFSESGEGGEYLLARWRADPLRAAPARRVEVPGHAAGLTLARRMRAMMLDPLPDRMALEQLALAFTALHRTLPAAGKPRARGNIARVLDRIAAEFDQPLTLAELAATYGATPLRFLREFARSLGMTPHAYLLEVRLQQARRMLRRTALPLAEVAAACGFAHQSHMGSVFTKEIGATPGRYRR